MTEKQSLEQDIVELKTLLSIHNRESLVKELAEKESRLKILLDQEVVLKLPKAKVASADKLDLILEKLEAQGKEVALISKYMGSIENYLIEIKYDLKYNNTTPFVAPTNIEEAIKMLSQTPQ